MPFGFAKYRLNEGIKPHTIKFQVITINQFLSYLSKEYPDRNFEPKNFKRKHINGFLKQQSLDLKLDDSTVYRKQSTLRVFFDFLYKTGQITLDPMEKVDFFAKKKTTQIFKRDDSILNFDYLTIYNKKRELLEMDSLPLKSKILFLLVLKGIQLADMYTLTIDKFTEGANGDFYLYYHTKFKHDAAIVFQDEEDIRILKEAIDTARSNQTPYILHTKKENGSYEASNAFNTRFYFDSLQKKLGHTLRSNDVRLAYIHYLHYCKQLSAFDISDMLGRPLKNIYKLMNESLERINNTNYNVIHVKKDRFLIPYKETVASEQLNLFSL